MSKQDPIYVTRPFIPPLEEYQALLEEIWSSQILSNNGAMTRRLEQELTNTLGSANFVAVNNGTTALQIAIKALELTGEIITTPFTWIATVGAIKAEGCAPRFCDIDPQTLNIDTTKIESMITPDTVAIMPVHVFGNPCDVHRIKEIADRYGLKVIYDAAQALGSTVDGSSALDFGDVSAVSLHATKLLNTAEGGGCVTTNQTLETKIRRSRNFGLDKNAMVVSDGVNGKLSELHAAMGLAGLPYFPSILADRRAKYELYVDLLSPNDKIGLQRRNGAGCNHMYFPAIFRSERELLRVQAALNADSIFPRRYFYPSLTQYEPSATGDSAPIADDIANRILCLPLYFTLPADDIQRICATIHSALND